MFRFLHFKTKTITSAGLLLGVAALGSGLLGLVRDRLLAGRFGAGEELDVYLAAFRIPDFLVAFFILGGVSAVFLPLFAEYREKDKAAAWEFVSNLFNIFLQNYNISRVWLKGIDSSLIT